MPILVYKKTNYYVCINLIDDSDGDGKVRKVHMSFSNFLSGLPRGLVGKALKYEIHKDYRGNR